MAVKELQQQLAGLHKLVDDNNQQSQKTVDALREQIAVVAQKMAAAGERVVVMIDRSNLDQTWRRVFSPDVNVRPDYLKIKDFVVGTRTCKQVRVYYSDISTEQVLDAERPDWERRQEFYKFLRYQGWLLRGVRKKVFGGVPVEKGLDAALIRDMDFICRENRCDTIILIAGDADYCEVVAEVQDRYCVKVEVAFFPNQTARDLVSNASKFINLDCVRDQLVREFQTR